MSVEAKPRGCPNHNNTSETQHSTANHPHAITVFADPLDAEQSFSMLSAGQYIQETPTLLMVLLASHYTTAHPFQDNVQRMYKRIVHCSKDVQAKRYAHFACIQTSSTHGLLPWECFTTLLDIAGKDGFSAVPASRSAHPSWCPRTFS